MQQTDTILERLLPLASGEDFALCWTREEGWSCQWTLRGKIYDAYHPIDPHIAIDNVIKMAAVDYQQNVTKYWLGMLEPQGSAIH